MVHNPATGAEIKIPTKMVRKIKGEKAAGGGGGSKDAVMLFLSCSCLPKDRIWD